MRSVDVVTIFPQLIDAALTEGVVARAREAGLVELRAWDLRAFTDDRHRSVDDEAFGGGLLDYPHYTRPAVWRGEAVPEVLLSGHHAEIEKWRRRERLRRTLERRPDLLERAGELEPADRAVLDELRKQQG